MLTIEFSDPTKEERVHRAFLLMDLAGVFDIEMGSATLHFKQGKELARVDKLLSFVVPGK